MGKNTMTEKKYNVLDREFHDITTQCIKFTEDDRRCYNKHLKQVLDCIIGYMKEDEVFKCLYSYNMYTGSFYENLRISKPDEFDINLIFVLPATCKIVYEAAQPGFVRIRVVTLDESYIKKHSSDAPNLNKILKKWIDKSGFLLRENFMQWMHGVFTRALNSIKTVSLDDTVIRPSSSGPAFTVYISTSKLTEYSIDLVPVFEFSDVDWPKPPVRRLHKDAKCKKWIVVPKPPPGVSDPTYWRMSFYRQEKELMNNLQGMKHIIKLMKLFREKEDWKFLSSYFIKTVFLWENERQDKDFWKNGVAQLFVHMLRRLSAHLDKHSIPFYWDKELNLLSKVKRETLENVNNRIIQVCKQIDAHLKDNPQLIKKYFGCELKELQESANELPSDNSCLHEGHISNTQSALMNKMKRISLTTSNVESYPVSVISDQQSSVFVSVTKNKNAVWRNDSELKGTLNVDEHRRIWNGKRSVSTQTENTSDPIKDILLKILKEQRDIKHHLQSTCEQYIAATSDLGELVQESKQIRRHFENSANQLFHPMPKVTNITNSQPLRLHSFGEQKSSFRNCLLPVTLCKHPPKRIPPSNEIMIVPKAKDSQFAELLEHFCLSSILNSKSGSNNEDLIKF